MDVKIAAVVCVLLRSGVWCSAVEFVCESECRPRAWYRKLKHLRKRRSRNRKRKKKKKQKQTRNEKTSHPPLLLRWRHRFITNWKFGPIFLCIFFFLFLSYPTIAHWHNRYVCELYPSEGLSSVRCIKSGLNFVTTSDTVYVINQPINSIQQNPYWERNIASATLENFRAFYVTRRIITRLTRARYVPQFWPRWIESMTSHTLSLRSVLILFSHLLLRLRSWSVPQAFPP